MGKTKTKTSSQSTESQTATTKNDLPSNLQTGLNGIIDRTNTLAGQDPYSLVPGASGLQSQAFTGAANLGGWQQGIGAAAGLAGQVANAPTNFASAVGYNAPQIAQNQMAPTMAPSIASLGGPAQMTASGYDPTLLGGPATYTAGQAGGTSIAPVGSYDVAGYNAPQATAQQGTASLGQASLGQASLGQASLGQSFDATAALAGAQQAGYQGYDAAMLGPAAQATAGQATSTDASGLLSRFYNPYQQQVIDAASADNAAQADKVRQQMAAQAAGSGAFGGSRYGIAQAQTEGELQRARDSLLANIRSQGFNTALNAALQQAGQDTGVSIANAGYNTDISKFNTGEQNTNSRLNTDATNRAREFGANAFNQKELTNAELGTRAAMGNADRLTSVSQGNADRATTTSNANADRLTNTSNSNARLLTDTSNSNADRLTNTSNSNARLLTDTSNSNAELGTRTNIANTGYAADAARFLADAGNRRASDIFTANNTRGIEQARLDASNNQFNVGQANDAAGRNTAAANDFAKSNQAASNQSLQDYFAALNRASEVNSNASNQFARDRFSAENDAARQYASDYNTGNRLAYSTEAQRLSDQARLNADASQFGANAFNSLSQFNAQAGDRSLDRQLNAADLYGNLASIYGSNARGDIGLQGELGQTQRDITQQQMLAPYSQLQMLADLYRSGAPLINQTVSSNGTSNSTGTQTQSMGVGSMLGGLAGSVLSGWASGGFKGLSDPALKTGVKRIGETVHGLGLYNFRYHWDEPDRVRTGVMADEVEDKAPHALGPIIKGFRTVDYGKLGLAHLLEA